MDRAMLQPEVRLVGMEPCCVDWGKEAVFVQQTASLRRHGHSSVWPHARDEGTLSAFVGA